MKFIRSVLLLALAFALFGCTSQSNPVPQPEPEFYEHTDAVEWNYEIVSASRTITMGPTDGARWYFMIHGAIYDAWAMYDEAAQSIALDPVLRRPEEQRTAENQRAAVNYAAYFALQRVFPAFDGDTDRLSGLLERNGFDPAEDGSAAGTPAWIGLQAVNAMWDSCAFDGSNEQNGFKDMPNWLYGDMYQDVNSGDPALPNAPGGAAHDPNHWTPIRIPTGVVRDEQGWARIDNDNSSSYRVMGNLTPHWGSVGAFALERGDEFRPPAPPRYGDDTPYTNSAGETRSNDEEAMRQLQEVVDLNGSLGDREKVIARYWAQELDSAMTPPGHLNMLTYGVSLRDEHTLEEDVKMLLALNAALFDSSIAAWDCKRAYNNNRPVTAVHHFFRDQQLSGWNGAGRDGETLLGKDWLPFMPDDFTSPPFPDYVSGHATFTAAFAGVLTAITGSNAMYDGETRTRHTIDFTTSTMQWTGEPQGDLLGEFTAAPGSSDIEPGISPAGSVTLRWNTFQEAAAESGQSRLYMGIHFREASLRGQELGYKVAEKVLARCAALWNGEAD